ncbi:PE-PPE domain-containing protein [Mycobacterium sp.]|uniref:PE-PPE domain-containing protein n=1 Tax=Mycobacterium sp. TaxID=1785 RepID=UPI0031DA3073
MQRALRPIVTAVIAVLSAACIAVTPVAPSPNVQVRGVRLMDDIAYIIGGSGTPIPSPSDVQTNFDLFVKPLYPGYTPEPLYTPEGNYGLYTGVKSLPLDTSEAQGTQILYNTITSDVANGNDVVIKGASQSSTISGMTMTELAAHHVPSSDVSFVLTGDPNAPDGGLFERLAGLSLPSLGITFNGATPADLYPTTIFTQEYDGFADVCQYPIDFVCDLNSIAGIEYVHPTYSTLTTAQVTPTTAGGDAIQLPTVGDTMTTYYMIPTADLPLLDPIREIPVIGNPLADLLQPDLEVLVNLGYGNPDYGWSQGPANVPTEFGLFPSVSELEKVPALLASGTEQGIENFIGDFNGSGPNPVSLSALLDPTSSTTASTDTLSALTPAGIVGDLTNLVNTLSSVSSTAYATLLPTADVINALVTSMPAYDVSLFTEGLQSGNLLEAIGQPIASDTYLVQLAAGFELFAVLDQLSTIGTELSGLTF